MKTLPANLKPLSVADLADMIDHYERARAEFFWKGQETASTKCTRNITRIKRELNRRIDEQEWARAEEEGRNQ